MAQQPMENPMNHKNKNRLEDIGTLKSPNIFFKLLEDKTLKFTVLKRKGKI